MLFPAKVFTNSKMSELLKPSSLNSVRLWSLNLFESLRNFIMRIIRFRKLSKELKVDIIISHLITLYFCFRNIYFEFNNKNLRCTTIDFISY